MKYNAKQGKKKHPGPPSHARAANGHWGSPEILAQFLKDYVGK